MGESIARDCINSGMTNRGTMMPPIAPIMMLQTPPIVVACSVVRAMEATSRAKEMEQQLIEAVIRTSPAMESPTPLFFRHFDSANHLGLFPVSTFWTEIVDLSSCKAQLWACWPKDTEDRKPPMPWESADRQ